MKKILMMALCAGWWVAASAPAVENVCCTKGYIAVEGDKVKLTKVDSPDPLRTAVTDKGGVALFTGLTGGIYKVSSEKRDLMMLAIEQQTGERPDGSVAVTIQGKEARTLRVRSEGVLGTSGKFFKIVKLQLSEEPGKTGAKEFRAKVEAGMKEAREAIAGQEIVLEGNGKTLKVRTGKDGTATFTLPAKGLFHAHYGDQKVMVIGNKGDEVLVTLRDIRGRTRLLTKIKE